VNIFSKYLLKWLEGLRSVSVNRHNIRDGNTFYTTDCSVTYTIGKFTVMLANIEIKRDFGDGNSDGFLQALQYYGKFWNQDSVKELKRQCHCPSLLLAVWSFTFLLLNRLVSIISSELM